ncbi:hypothetical Protein YC6258_01295 [Gynuella sunshinyii YC6258]|uniref:Uncharacterized protein n=1 Tax=Gynuella sunshinyii YC6258 TaxID=1445510 RepID=A0A0C5VIZ5_9GAMM|nr:hypothetical Protein YC6258_01295 [Gynuella sunshinyii YC6258]
MNTPEIRPSAAWMLLSSQQGCFHGVFDFRCIHLNQVVGIN